MVFAMLDCPMTQTPKTNGENKMDADNVTVYAVTDDGDEYSYTGKLELMVKMYDHLQQVWVVGNMVVAMMTDGEYYELHPFVDMHYAAAILNKAIQ